MLPKTWFEEDFLLIGINRGQFIFLVFKALLVLVIYTLLCYGLGRAVLKQWFKKLYWWAFYWIEHWRW